MQRDGDRQRLRLGRPVAEHVHPDREQHVVERRRAVHLQRSPGMSSSGCEAIPIDSPSSIQSDSPSEFVRRYADTSEQPEQHQGREAPSCSGASRAAAGLVGGRRRLPPGDPSERPPRQRRGPQRHLPITSTLRRPGPSSPPGGAVGEFGPAAGQPFFGSLPVGRHGEQAPLAVLVHEPVAVVGRLRHERPVGHRAGAERDAGRRRDLPAHVDAVDAELVGHHLRLERAAEDAAAGEQALLAAVRVDQRLQVVPQVRLVLDARPARGRCCWPWRRSSARRSRRRPRARRPPARVPARGLPSRRAPSVSTPWSTRTAPTPPSTDTAAVVTIR